MSDFLAEVTAQTRKRVDVQKARVPVPVLRAHLPTTPVRSFRKAIEQPGRVSLIAELKQASPSAGLIRKVEDIPAQISAYARGGAAALSILTEEDYFHGSPQLLENARKHTNLPILRKDFIIDLYQILESKTLGADALLLIASLLPGKLLRDFIVECEGCGLDALVEVNSLQELEHAVASKAAIIGINNRNLHTLRVDTSTATKLLPKATGKGLTIVVESGIQSPAELRPLQDLGAHAVLVGEALMRSEHPEFLVREFVQACRK